MLLLYNNLARSVFAHFSNTRDAGVSYNYGRESNR